MILNMFTQNEALLNSRDASSSYKVLRVGQLINQLEL